MGCHEEVDRLIRRLDRGFITGLEFIHEVCRYATSSAGGVDEVLAVLDTLSSHPNEDVRRGAQQARDVLFPCKSLNTDITHIRHTSPLQPGTRLTVGGGYTSAYAPPHWLNGREYLPATFIDFVGRGADKMPGALIQLDDRFDLPGVQGRYALLTLRYVADWAETETVAVHIVDVPPEAIGAFASAPPEGTEVESHATYIVETGAANADGSGAAGE